MSLVPLPFGRSLFLRFAATFAVLAAVSLPLMGSDPDIQRIPSCVEFRATPSHTNLDTLNQDSGLQSIVTEASMFLRNLPSGELESDALFTHLSRLYDRVSRTEGDPQFEYIWIYVDGVWERFCYLPEEILVEHRGLGTVSILIKSVMSLG